MATLVIDRNINQVISQMEADIPSLKGEERAAMEYKLDLALSYRERKGLDLKVIEVRSSLLKGTERYLSAMRDLVKKAPGVSYCKRGDKFIARVMMSGRRLYLGAYEKPSEAIEVLKQNASL